MKRRSRLFRRCKKSPNGKHEFKTSKCIGSWHHCNDQDATGREPSYWHKRKKCLYCGFEICYGWDRSKKVVAKIVQYWI